MTPEEFEILKVISCRDVETFLPAGGSAAQARAFDALVDTLRRMERMGWVGGPGSRAGRDGRALPAEVRRGPGPVH